MVAFPSVAPFWSSFSREFFVLGKNVDFMTFNHSDGNRSTGAFTFHFSNFVRLLCTELLRRIFEISLRLFETS